MNNSIKNDSNDDIDIIIIAPHADDEIIGCYEILKNNKCIIIYSEIMNDLRKEETLKLNQEFNIKDQLYNRHIPNHLLLKKNIFYFPDPVYELHPSHRLQGQFGESFARVGFNVIFYSTNMNAPYIHEVSDSKNKENKLNSIYSSQNDLWKYDKKYILFEGRVKWLF